MLLQVNFLIIKMKKIRSTDATKTLRSQSYKKSVPKSEQSLKQTFKNKWYILNNSSTNLLYKVGGFQMPTLWPKITFSNNTILGTVYSNQAEAKQALQKIIWFTYRSNFKVSDNINSDTGWGCLIRVGQMLLASALQKYFAQKSKSLSETTNNIIFAFLDDEGPQQKYSVSCIMKIANKQFDFKPGQWFNIPQIAYVLEKMQNKSPMVGSNQLKIITYNESVIFLQNLYSLAGVPMCKCQQKKIVCNVCHIQNQSQDMSQLEKFKKTKSIDLLKNTEIFNKIQNADRQQKPIKYLPFKKHLLIIVCVRAGLDKIPISSYQGMLNLIHLNTSLGIIGGIPKRALYIVGSSQNQLVYLDPHYVQSSVNRRNYLEFVDTFFCKQFRKLGSSSIDPSMAFCFYIKNLEELNELVSEINSLKQRDQNDFVSVLWDKQQGRSSYQLSKSLQVSFLSDDQFQA